MTNEQFLERDNGLVVAKVVQEFKSCFERSYKAEKEEFAAEIVEKKI